MKLPQPELWLIDWVLCGQGETVTSNKLESIMVWRDLRERVWRAQLAAELASPDPAKKDTTEADLELSTSEMEQLLGILPTTFRWGTGEDVGFALKRRIAQELWQAEEAERLRTARAIDNTVAAILRRTEKD